MNYRLLLLYILLGYLAISITADQLPGISLKIPPIQPENSQLRFIENLGQWDERIQYKVPLQGGSLLLEHQRLTWHFSQFPASIAHHGHEAHSSDVDIHQSDEEVIKTHTYQINFKNANPNAHLESSHQFEAYHNYFLGKDRSRWKGGVSQYGIITYKELYSGIDMRMYGIADAIKYDFIVQPYTTTDAIQLQYEGAEVSLKDGNLHIHTSIRDITELAPVAYQEIEGKKVEVLCEYKLEKDVLTFEFPNGYDNSYELIIDPTLIFSTFTGSTMDNWGFTATYDNDGNAYAGGIVYFGGNVGATGYPTTIGAFQRSYRGGAADIVISKFDGTGNNLLYSTFLGGNAHDQPHSLIVNDANELFVLGRTNSPNFPTTFAAFDSDINGQYDLLVSKFSANGANLLASTFLGGSNNDGVNITEDASTFSNLKYNYGDDARGEIILDDLGNVYVASPTSSANFPTTAGAFQPNIAGLQDGCIVKLTPDLNMLIWSSYLGGNNNDAAYAMQVDNEYNVYVTGGTMSNNFPTTAGVYQPSYQGFPFDSGYDGFITKINNDGSTILASTFLGTNQNDQSYFIQLDDDNEVYVYGQTTGAWPIISPAAGNVYFNANGKQFITKLDNDLTDIIYSTVFGGSNRTVPNISPTAFLVDKCENVYASGWGGGTNTNLLGFGNEGLTLGLPTTTDAIQTRTSGDDLYLIVLSENAQNLLYGTFFGGDDFFGNGREHLDGGTCRFDKNGVIYHAVCAGCGGSNAFPTTPGAWSNTNRSTNCNMAVFKIAFELTGIDADFVPLDTLNDPIVNFSGCAPLTVNFENTSRPITGSTTTSYFWNFDDNGAVSRVFEPSHTFRDSGTYNVMLVIQDPQSCNEFDTTYSLIEVFPPVSVDAGPGFNLCPGDSVSLTGSGTGNNLTYQWTPTTGLFDPTNPNTRAAPTSTTIYTLRVTNENGCVGTDTLTVFVDPQLITDLGRDTTICANETLQLNASSPNAQSFSWSPNTFLDDPNSPTPIISGLDTTTTYVVSLISPVGCSNTDTITVSPFDITIMPDTLICAGDSIPLIAATNDPDVAFSWTPTTSLSNPNVISPSAAPLTTTTYTLTATRPSGCSVSKTVTIQVNPIPLADAGLNDTICAGESLQLAGSGGFNYAWTPNLNITDVNISNPIVNPSVSTTYTLTVSDDIGCSAEDSVRIEVGEIPIVSAGDDQTICQGEAAQLMASGAISYQWTGPSITDPSISDPFAQPQSSATYTVVGTNIWGCTAQDDMTINVEAAPITTIENPGQICLGDTVTLRATGGDTYIWSTGDTAESVTIIPTPNSLYYATALNQSCTGNTDSIRINVSTDFPAVLFIPNTSEGFAPAPISFLNLTSFANRYEWDFGTGAPVSTEFEPVHTFASAGEYQVRLIAWSASGCSDTAFWNVRINNISVHIPSAFTPNNDGFNDEFFIGQVGLRLIQMRIFTRWGQMIYESNDPNFVWDGTFKGRILPEGVYTYAFKGLGENDILYEKSGTITLVK